MTTKARLVFIGGGHSHAIALKSWGLKPLPSVELTLISDVIHTPYSGMLPGYVAGFYNFAETHIDLQSLARFAGANFCLDRAEYIDIEKSQVIRANGSPVAFDYLAIDIGSTPDTVAVKGAREYAIPAKPVPRFLQGWQEILENATKSPDKPLSIAIVGGGAGGVELALNMQAHLENLRGTRQGLTLHLVHRGEKLLPDHNHRVSQRLETILKQREIRLSFSETVTEVQPRRLLCESGLILDADSIIWVTSASAPKWIAESGLATDERGFILVENTLQSLSHPRVFATGDIASIENYPRPKAGVFAVRQGQPLFENLQRIIQGKPLKPYFPQKDHLSLIGTGDKRAIASRGSFFCESSLMWWWKDRIDRSFMKQFQLTANSV
ncbi:FAD-dependent oxidoreductase [Pannus brasiliensis CCIBt3594]|uniref:FAD-dependent oxidoreductase n=1 Tax=Pannus brasiliensis CCIBt3594 TaxID=1427578 RepID=A0AAW9QSW3_9CHRO